MFHTDYISKIIFQSTTKTHQAQHQKQNQIPIFRFSTIKKHLKMLITTSTAVRPACTTTRPAQHLLRRMRPAGPAKRAGRAPACTPQCASAGWASRGAKPAGRPTPVPWPARTWRGRRSRRSRRRTPASPAPGCSAPPGRYHELVAAVVDDGDRNHLLGVVPDWRGNRVDRIWIFGWETWPDISASNAKMKSSAQCKLIISKIKNSLFGS